MNDYITYAWVGKEAKGSYYVGKLSVGKGQKSVNRSEQYELRMYNGNQRLDAESNILRGDVFVSPSNPFTIASPLAQCCTGL